IGYAAVRLVGDFPRVYVNTVFGAGVLSLLFYAPDQAARAAGVDFRGAFAPLAELVGAQNHFHILVHCFGTAGWEHRNAGFFWEPGAFAGYLLLALIFLGLTKDRFERRAYQRRLILLSVCLLTTMSTMGYVVFPLVLLVHFRWRRRPGAQGGRRLLAAYAAVVVLAVSAWAVWERSFVKRKLLSQSTDALERAHGWEINRFGTLIFDWEYVQRRPLFGWGLHSHTRYMLHPWAQVAGGQGNGMSDFVARFGLVGFAVFGLCVWRSMLAVTKGDRLRSAFVLVLLVLMLNGETFLSYPLFLGLMFLAVPRPAARAAMLPVHRGAPARAVCG
ncbi:MAG TPA: O-antigen ligase family protein, partial [Phycisphaerae bacterium]|nr:O-antigen ligase family protein [Phycisphaerae bacterium]